MVLQAVALDQADISEACHLHLSAFADNPVINAMYPGSAQSPEWLQHMSIALETALNVSSPHLLKVQSPETGQIMGIAQWQEYPATLASGISTTSKSLPEGANIAAANILRQHRMHNRKTVVGEQSH